MSLMKYVSVKLYFVANALDALLTIIGSTIGLQEANPIMALLLKFPIIFLGIKLLGGIIISKILINCPLWFQKTIAGAMWAIVIWNLILILIGRN